MNTQIIILAQKIVEILTSNPPEILEQLTAELVQLIPTTESQTEFKIGSGIFPEEQERSMSIFIQVNPVSQIKVDSLEKVWIAILEKISPEIIQELDEILTDFQEDAILPYDIQFMPATMIAEKNACIHLSFSGKLKAVEVHA